MKTAEERLAEAKLAERLARARWFDTFELMQTRTTPSTIADEAVEQIKETAGKAVTKAKDAVRERPGTVVAVASAIGLFLARKPIIRAVKKTLSQRKETRSATNTLSEKKHTSVGPRPDPTPKTIPEEV